MEGLLGGGRHLVEFGEDRVAEKVPIHPERRDTGEGGEGVVFSVDGGPVGGVGGAGVEVEGAEERAGDVSEELLVDNGEVVAADGQVGEFGQRFHQFRVE